jgi:hypothetical protein
MIMKALKLSDLLPRSRSDSQSRVRAFALLNLGVVASLSDGTLSPQDATQYFFNGENCLFVQKGLRNKVANEIMGRGNQLYDLFEVLPHQQAKREFRSELHAIQSLCLELVKSKPSRKSAKSAQRAAH